MKRALEVVLGIALCFAPSSYAEVVVFVDGSEMEVESYEVRDKLLVLTDSEGTVCSIALTVVNLEATKQANRDAGPLVSVKIDSPDAMPADARPTRVRPAKPRPAEAHVAIVRPPDSPGVGFSVSAGNQLSVGGSSTKVEELLGSLGLKSLVFEMPDVVSVTIVQAERYMPEDGPGVSGTVRGAFEQAFQADRIYPIVSRAFAERAEDSKLESALLSLDSAFNRRMNELELLARTAEGLQLLQEYTVELESTMPPAARLEKLQRLDEATGVTDAHVARRLQMLRAVMKAFNQLVPQDRRMTEDAINLVIERGRPTLRVSMKNYSLVRSLFTYRSASDAELEKYIAFWETDEGRWLNRLTQESLSAGMLHGFETAMKHLTQQAERRARVSSAEPKHVTEPSKVLPGT